MPNSGFGFHSLKVRLIALIAVLGAALFFYSVSNFVGDWQQLARLQEIARYKEIAVAASNLAHELQKERGMSAGFLASKGSKFGGELRQQRVLSDQRAEKFRALIAAAPPQLLSGRIKATLSAGDQQRARSADQRRGVDTLTLSPGDAIAYYTTSIERLVELVANASVLTDDASVANILNTYLMVLNAKEYAGRERATRKNRHAANSGWPGR